MLHKKRPWSIQRRLFELPTRYQSRAGKTSATVQDIASLQVLADSTCSKVGSFFLSTSFNKFSALILSRCISLTSHDKEHATQHFLLWKEIPNIFTNSLAMWYCFDILITTYFFLILQLHLLQGFNPNSWHVSLSRHLCKRNQFTSLIKKHVGCKSEQRYSIINWLESHST